MTPVSPTLERERAFLERHPFVIACDEVGRGAIAGPVVVGATVITSAHVERPMPEGLRDSKLIAETRRHDVATRSLEWVGAAGVGWSPAPEIDEVGIMRALGLAALRAIGEAALGADLDPRDGVILLDGNFDYIIPAGGRGLRVVPVKKGDRDCASAAAASVIAKVARDDYMARIHSEAQAYQWDRNKGYGSAGHREAIAQFGTTPHHRVSWSITGDTLF